MKKNYLTLFVLFASLTILAQSPQAFKYQAIARDEVGNVLSMWDISLRVSLLQEGIDGQIEYVETHRAQTNIYGLINLIIGEGEVVKGDFSSIKWGESRHYIKIEMDIDGGEDYQDVGISQLYAVPYALYAEEAGQLKQPEPSYKTSQNPKPVKSNQSSSGPRVTPNSKISSGGHSWFSALTGKVGIGTASPTQLLSVYNGELVLQTDDNLEDQSILFQNNGDKYTWRIYRTDAAGNNADLRIAGGSNTDFTALSDIMTFTHNGNVGIGTTAPAGILDIAGAYHFPDTDGTSGQVLQTDGSGTLSWNNKSTTYTIGDFAYGGIVFWVDETGQHGLVCAKEDQSTGVRWYAGTSGHTRAYGNGPLSGEMNTSIIISAHVAIGDDGDTYAARICNELRITIDGKQYGDWYLPSKRELNLMYQNKTTIDVTAVANGGQAFVLSIYNSSTEDSSSTAWVQSFIDGSQISGSKTGLYMLRAIRAF